MIKLERLKKWKDFENCLFPIFQSCEMCKANAVCIFHEQWYGKVKLKFLSYI